MVKKVDFTEHIALNTLQNLMFNKFIYLKYGDL